MTFVPLIGIAIILFIPENKPNYIKWASAVFTFIPLLLAIQLFITFDRTSSQMQFVEHYPWIKAFNIEYFIGVDGVSIMMVLLTALLGFICIFASWGIDKSVKGYFSLFHLLQTGMMGVFVALDFFLFYIFWEAMLLPMYFLIGIWGGPRREYAAIKFFLYTLFGSVLMLLAIIVFYFNVKDPVTGGHTFNMLHIMNQSLHSEWLKNFDVRLILYIALFIAFAIKVPTFPFHTWLPDAHVEAPTAISVVLAGILLKMGTYGMLRINYPMLPDIAQYTYFALAIIGVVNIIYGAFCAMAQEDFKKLVAYSSISHMGFVLLGMAAMTPAAINGAVLQMFNHGTVTAMLFLLVGVIYDRAHHRIINNFGGLANQMPVYAGISYLAFLAALGLPGLSSFVSEALVFIGSFQVDEFRFRAIVLISTLGIVLTAVYVLWMLHRVFWGQIQEKYKELPEINGREIFTLVPLALIVIFVGIYPMPVIDLMNNTLLSLMNFVQQNGLTVITK
jgi:NADH-quinone oxidoreductase subunit M